jgi:hypothetical protein
MRWRLSVVMVGVLAAAVAPGAQRPPARAQTAGTMALFIEAVRGYDVTTIRRTFPAYNQGLFATLFGAGEPIPLASPEYRALFSEQIVTTPAGQELDVGHVITGIEAGTALPPAARLAQATTGCSMIAAVTWSGDVGKALHDYLIDPVRGAPASYYDAEANPADLLGDVDGWVLGAEAAGVPVDVAALLESAYLNGDLEATRFRRFGAQVGGADGGALSDAARARVRDEITCFARAFATFTGSGITAERIAAESPYFVERFTRYIEDGLAREASPTPNP